MSALALFLTTYLLATTTQVQGASRGVTRAASTGLCDSCLVAVRVLEDALCDAEAVDFIVETATKQLCPATPDPDECVTLAQALLPVAIEWLRSSATPASLCAAAGVCGEALRGDPVWDKAPARLVDDLSCPLCKHVVAAVQKDAAAAAAATAGGGGSAAAAGAPLTGGSAAAVAAFSAASLRSSAVSACRQLPGEMAAACVSEMDKRGLLLRLAVGASADREVGPACELMGMCVEGLGRLRAPPLSPHLVTHLSALAAALAGARGRLRGAAAAAAMAATATAVRDNRCDICKLAVLEVATLVANPEVQQAVLVYAEAACDAALPPPSAADCRDLVDTSLAALFAELVAALDPDLLCERMRLCAARPTAVAVAAAAMS